MRRLQTRSSPVCSAAETFTTILTATADKEPYSQPGEVTCATKSLQTLIRDIRITNLWLEQRNVRQKKHHCLLSLAETSFEQKG